MATVTEFPPRRLDTPAIRTLTTGDLRLALSEGLADFLAVPTHLIFVSLIYPVVGLLLFRASFRYDLVPLVFPILAGFALIGPFAAIGLYEVSRLRERGEPVTWRSAFGVFNRRSIAAILLLGLGVTAVFIAWLAAAYGIYVATFGPQAPASASAFITEVFTTAAGLRLLIAGNLVGLGFAVVAMTVSVISFPMLVDRNIDAVRAVMTSIEVVRRNPLVMLEWGLIVTAALVAGSIPFLFGLAVVMPVLGHATWHLYRRAVV